MESIAESDGILFAPIVSTAHRRFVSAAAIASAMPLSGRTDFRPPDTSDMPMRGTAQVWRATLKANGQTASCWVLRRFGSGLLFRDIELVSDIRLRDKLALDKARNWPAKVTMRGTWGAPQKLTPGEHE